jgi:hypothetical protein
MEEDFIYQIHLKETPDNSLYKWSLCEKNSEGSQIGSDVIPFNYNIYFSVSNLNIRTNFNNDPSDSFEKINPHVQIRGELISGIVQNNHAVTSVVEYSILGVNRKINSFEFTIQQAEFDTESEHCTLFTQIAHEYEVGFRYTQVPDSLIFEIRLNQSRFQKLLKLIQSENIDSIHLLVSGVEGFYSDWSPSIFPHSIKVLSDNDKQIIHTSQECNVIPKRTSVVHEFSISCNSSRTYFTEESVDDAFREKAKNEEEKWISQQLEEPIDSNQIRIDSQNTPAENQSNNTKSLFNKLFT